MAYDENSDASEWTTMDRVYQWADAYGADHPEKPWLLSDFDTWERNPHYQGPRVAHPETLQEGCPEVDKYEWRRGPEQDDDDIPF